MRKRNHKPFGIVCLQALWHSLIVTREVPDFIGNLLSGSCNAIQSKVVTVDLSPVTFRPREGTCLTAFKHAIRTTTNSEYKPLRASAKFSGSNPSQSSFSKGTILE
ncbi:hypothetical protein M758_6G000100 [Ceratodon purpureus]|nr:hypothetical protein M758_6G000100 [Ceratodon purpureus]